MKPMDWKMTSWGKLLYSLGRQLPLNYLNLAKNFPRAIVEFFGLKVQIKYFFVPMFHDTTWVGRGLSIFSRIAILFSGTILLILGTLTVWLLVPIMLVLPILGIWYNATLLVIWLIILLLIVAWKLSTPLPGGKLGDRYKPADVIRALPNNLGNLVLGYPNNYSNWWTDEDVNFWLKRMDMNKDGVNKIEFNQQPGQQEKLIKQPNVRLSME